MKTVPWLTADEARQHLGLPTLNSFYVWLHRERKRVPKKIRVSWLRGRMRFRETNLDACMEPEREVTRTTLRMVSR